MSSSKRSHTNKHDKSKKSYPKPRSFNNQFVSSHAQFKYTMKCKKLVIFDRSVVISKFRHLNLASILENNSLQYFILIKEQVYPNVVILFYSNLSFEDNVIHSRVGNYEINMPMKVFARILHLSSEGVDIYNHDFGIFWELPCNESSLITSYWLHNSENSALVKNEEVKYFTLISQVLVKIIFYNILPKSGEYSHARGLFYFLSIAFWMALESISPSLSLIVCSLRTIWSRIGIFPLGWWLLIFWDISKLICLERLLFLLLLISIVPSSKRCK